MLRGQGSKEARITRIALDKTLKGVPTAIAQWIVTRGQADFENDHTELIGDLAHEMQTYCIDGGYEIDLDDCITLVSEDMPYGAGYDLFNRSYNRTDRYIRFLTLLSPVVPSAAMVSTRSRVRRVSRLLPIARSASNSLLV